MKIGILGSGNVGGTLGHALAKAGHEVMFAVRDVDAPENQTFVGERTSFADVPTTAKFAEVVILATPWNVTEQVIEQAGDLSGKTLIDATNPIGPGFVLTHGHNDSGGEQVQRWAGEAKVVKCFNTTGFENMANPDYGDHRVGMFVAGNDEDSRKLAMGLATDIGFEPVDAGDLKAARLMEPTAMLWIQLALMRGQGRGFAFGFLRR